MTYYEILQARRKEIGMQFDELAEKSGIPKSTATRILTGRTNSPRIDTLIALAHAMDLTIDDLDETTKTESNAKEECKTEHLTEDEEKLLNLYRSLNEEAQRNILYTVETMAESHKAKEERIRKSAM